MPVANIIELRQLLAERFPGLRTRADELSAARHTFWPTGLPQLDEPLRGGLAKGALAEIGALSCFASHRRDALWEVEKPLRQDDLFESAATATAAAVIDREAASPLAPMNYSERIQADFAGMQLTTGAHPMALLRPWLAGISRAADLPNAKHGSTVRIAGNVICRQRPGTAKGFVFVSLEDETGISNAIVTPPMFEAHRFVITEEPFLVIEGKLQHVKGVIHVKAQRIERLRHDPVAATRSYDFH